MPSRAESRQEESLNGLVSRHHGCRRILQPFRRRAYAVFSTIRRVERLLLKRATSPKGTQDLGDSSFPGMAGSSSISTRKRMS